MFNTLKMSRIYETQLQIKLSSKQYSFTQNVMMTNGLEIDFFFKF